MAPGGCWSPAQDDSNAIKFFNEAHADRAARSQISPGARRKSHLRLHDYQEAAADYDKAFAIGLKEREQRHFGYLGRGYASLMMADFGMAVKLLQSRA